MKITSRTQTKNLKKAKNILEDVLETIAKYKNCYFWSNTGNASYRRSQEFNEKLNLNIFNDNVEIELDLTISYRNFYFTKDIYVNGKKSNAKKLQGYIKKIDTILLKRGINE